MVGVAISVLSLVGVVWWATKQQAPQLPSGAAQIGALGAAVVLYAVATALRGEVAARPGGHA